MHLHVYTTSTSTATSTSRGRVPEAFNLLAASLHLFGQLAAAPKLPTSSRPSPALLYYPQPCLMPPGAVAAASFPPFPPTAAASFPPATPRLPRPSSLPQLPLQPPPVPPPPQPTALHPSPPRPPSTASAALFAPTSRDPARTVTWLSAAAASSSLSWGCQLTP